MDPNVKEFSLKNETVGKKMHFNDHEKQWQILKYNSFNHYRW